MATDPQPPYEGHAMSPRWREVPFEELPVGLQRRLQRETDGDDVVVTNGNPDGNR